MNPIAKLLLIAGIVLIVAGLFWHFGNKVLPLGRLPGDFALQKGDFRFYFPIATSILISIVLSLIVWLFNFFRK